VASAALERRAIRGGAQGSEADDAEQLRPNGGSEPKPEVRVRGGLEQLRVEPGELRPGDERLAAGELLASDSCLERHAVDVDARRRERRQEASGQPNARLGVLGER